MSATNIATPPGTKLFPNDIPVLNQTHVKFQINVANNGSYTAPLSALSINPRTPIVQAVASDENGDSYSLNIYSICFIGYTGADPAVGSVSKNFNAYYEVNSDDASVMDIYISYNEPPIQASSFSAYQFTFQITNTPATIKTANVFLWDEDPETSRGTETAVRSGVGEIQQ